jgi:hypothetical protein
MNQQLGKDLQVWCEQLALRLPELRWKLPYWPKHYQNLIPSGLFQVSQDWTPAQAITEVQKHIFRLSELSSQSAKAQFLSQKILRQIDILVFISKKLPPQLHYPIEKNAVTRAEYIEKLKLQIDDLGLQKKALERNLAFCAFPEAIELEIQKVQEQITSLHQLLSKA